MKTKSTTPTGSVKKLRYTIQPMYTVHSKGDIAGWDVIDHTDNSVVQSFGRGEIEKADETARILNEGEAKRRAQK